MLHSSHKESNPLSLEKFTVLDWSVYVKNSYKTLDMLQDLILS